MYEGASSRLRQRIRNKVTILRGLDGRGHLETKMISFKRRTLNKDVEKYSKFKPKIYRLLLLGNSLQPNKS